jgi:Dimerisation domain
MAHRDGGQKPPVASPAMALGLATAYQVSQALAVAVRLAIPDLLAGGAKSSADLAQETGTQPDKMYRLLRALAAFDVVKDLGGEEFELAPGGQFLCTDAPNSVRPTR